MTTLRPSKTLVFVATLLLQMSATRYCEANEQAGSDKKPLKVFVLVGQSNMQGHAHVRTIDAMRLNPKAAPLLKLIRNADGTNKTCKQTWVSSIGSADEEKTGRLTVGYGAERNGPKIGPEYMFGLAIEDMLDEPVLIIKTAWGGKSLHTDFRPPSASAYEFSEKQLETFKKQGKDIEKIKADKLAATGHYYRLTLEHVNSVLADIQRVYPDYDAKLGYELSGMVWFQGWNDMVDGGNYPSRDQPGGYDQYSHLLAHFIRDVRKDLDTPNLPFVIGVMGVGGITSQYGPGKQRYKNVHQNFRDAMAVPASMDEFKGSVVTVLTENFWDMQVVELRDREQSQLKAKVDEIKAAMKNGDLNRDEGQLKIDKLYAELFDKRELEILKQSTSNFEFHYLGSAGIMAQIGQGFAKAMYALIK